VNFRENLLKRYRSRKKMVGRVDLKSEENKKAEDEEDD